MSETAASRKRPTRPPKPVLPEEAAEAPNLTPAELTELSRRLEERRTALVASIDGRREQERDSGREVGDEMDEANTEGATALSSRLLERDLTLLREIEHAQHKMQVGTYGRCEGTGEPIGHARLLLRPWARFSVEHQEELERLERTRGA